MKIEDLRKAGQKRTPERWVAITGTYGARMRALGPPCDRDMLAVYDAEFIALAANHWDAICDVLEAASIVLPAIECEGPGPIEQKHDEWCRTCLLAKSFAKLEEIP